MFKKFLLLLLLLFLIFNQLQIQVIFSQDLKQKLEPEINVTDLNNSNTIVTPVMDTKIDKQKNMIYCATMQMAWNELTKSTRDNIIKIDNEPEYLAKINLLINQPALASKNSYLLYSGIANENTQKNIIDSIKKKFYNQLTTEELQINLDLTPGDLFAFSVLFKNLNFIKNFDKIDKHEFNYNGKKVKIQAFGIDVDGFQKNELIEQLELFYDQNNYSAKSDDEVVIKIKLKSDSDEIIISNFKPQKTLEKTYKAINNYIVKKEKKELTNKPLTIDDFLKSLGSIGPKKGISNLVIPKIKFNLNMYYNKMCGNIISGKYSGYALKKAFQKIKFDLTEQGVRLFSYAVLVGEEIGIREEFVIDRPFFIYLKDKGSAQPYFMAYIANDELLVKSN